MRHFLKTTVLVGAALALAVVGAACNCSTDDPSTSNNQVSIATVLPTIACVDSDGTEQGNPPVNVITDTQNVFTFQSRVRGGSATSQWNDAILTSVDISYTMDDGGFVPPRNGVPVNIVVKANGTGSSSVVTVPAATIVEYLSDAGRLGKVTLRFKGKDAGGEPVTVNPVEVPLETLNACAIGQ